MGGVLMICISEMRSVIPNDVDDEFEDEERGKAEGRRESEKRVGIIRGKTCKE